MARSMKLLAPAAMAILVLLLLLEQAQGGSGRPAAAAASSRCAAASVEVEQVNTGEKGGAGGRDPVFEVTVRNRCACAVRGVVLRSEGFASSAAVDPRLFRREGPGYLVGFGLFSSNGRASSGFFGLQAKKRGLSPPDLNFWGAVYPTYFALPYLKASRGNIVVTSSVAGRVPTARMSFYNASKGTVIRFYETLRAELGSHVCVTILMPGYVVSNLTKGKGLQKDGHVGIDEEARDINVGLMPVGKTESLAAVVVASVRRGDSYVTWPGC
ncbi:hypothetical protein ACP4OV_008927 [Aristida adscensionis]